MSTSNENTHPTLEQLLTEIGEVGDWLAQMRASEGTGGNISVCMDWEIDPSPLFPDSRQVELPFAAADMAGKSFLVTGSGTRLRDLHKDPLANIGFLRILDQGQAGLLYTHPNHHFTRLTSEFNSHLSLHQREMAGGDTSFNAVVHAQPVFLTYLTSIPAYQDSARLSQAIFRWQPEMIVAFPQGLAFLPFRVPNSDDLMRVTREVDAMHKLIVWAKHGALSVSSQSVTKALDLIEYAEAGAHYEYLNQINQGSAEGLNSQDIAAICDHFNLNESIFRPAAN